MAFVRKREYPTGKATWQIVDKGVTPIYRRNLGEVTAGEARRLLREYERGKGAR